MRAGNESRTTLQLSASKANEGALPFAAFVRFCHNMRDLIGAKWIMAKGILFLCLGLVTGSWILFEHPTTKTGLLLAIAIWSFCRFYYFAFYVLGRYVDASYKFSGLLSFARYLFRKE
jgi:hypothetical protein